MKTPPISAAQGNDARAERPGVVLVLGGGAARGVAHIGVLQVLEEQAIPVRAVVGTSIGAQIGAFFAAGVPVSALIELSVNVDWKQTLQFFLPDAAAGGLSSGKYIRALLSEGLSGKRIEALPLPYLAIATDLETGEYVVLDRGPVIDAVRASISLPGLLAPYRHDGRLLVDGGLVNPLPFDVARVHFGGPVLAVGVHPGARVLSKQEMLQPRSPTWRQRARQLLEQPWVKRAQPFRQWLESQLGNGEVASQEPVWRTGPVLMQAMSITQAQLVRLRAAISPPDLMLMPDVHRIRPLEFYRAREAIQAGYSEARARLPEIRALLARNRMPPKQEQEKEVD